MEEWTTLQEFPDYAVSNRGQVMSELTGRVLKLTVNQRGRVMTGPVLKGVQYRRSVDLLVAKTYLEPPNQKAFNSVIHLDGDYENNYAENLMWRPRWFRIAYHRQFYMNSLLRISRPIYCVDTDEVFPNSRDCSMKYGLLEKEIVMSLTNKNGVWPYGFEFRYHRE